MVKELHFIQCDLYDQVSTCLLQVYALAYRYDVRQLKNKLFGTNKQV